MTRTFDTILLLGRPASGKSEFIDFLKLIPEPERSAKYHIGPFREMDDFPWIWEKFIEDNIWEKAGYPRRYSTGGENPGLHPEGGPLFDFCMAKFNAEYKREENSTLIIEFARGGEGAYKKSLHQLSPEILSHASILFLLVSFEESCRRNEARYQEKLKHSILAHKVTDISMNAFYRTHDWLELTQGNQNGYLNIRDLRVPFLTVNNEPELKDPLLLGKRYQPALSKLHELYAGITPRN